MQQIEINNEIKQYFVSEVLDGKDVGLDYETPLLEWGVLNSLETVRLAKFIEEKWDIKIPNQSINAETFKDIKSISLLIMNYFSQQRTKG